MMNEERIEATIDGYHGCMPFESLHVIDGDLLQYIAREINNVILGALRRARARHAGRPRAIPRMVPLPPGLHRAFGFFIVGNVTGYNVLSVHYRTMWNSSPIRECACTYAVSSGAGTRGTDARCVGFGDGDGAGADADAGANEEDPGREGGIDEAAQGGEDTNEWEHLWNDID